MGSRSIGGWGRRRFRVFALAGSPEENQRRYVATRAHRFPRREPREGLNGRSGAPRGVTTCLHRDGAMLCAGNSDAHSQLRIWDLHGPDFHHMINEIVAIAVIPTFNIQLRPGHTETIEFCNVA